jgi:uncharacterized protein DUF4123
MTTQKLISEQQTEQIIQQLWFENASQNEKNNGEPVVYAILDGSRSEKIYPMLSENKLRYSCLYEGKLNYELTLAAPYIVRLEKDADFTRELIQQAWGNSWGIFAITYAPTTLLAVRRNCRKIAYVLDAESKKYVFRYYDPRVFRIYLPTCDALETAKVFGPVTEYVIEGENPQQLHRFIHTAQGAIDINQHDFNPESIKDIKLKHKIPNEIPRFNILKIRDQQMAALTNHALEKDFQEIKKQFISDFVEDPTKPLVINEKHISLDMFLRACLREALYFKIDDHYSIYSFCQMNYQYGWKFWMLESMAWAKKLLESPRAGDIKIEKIEHKFSIDMMERL